MRICIIYILAKIFYLVKTMGRGNCFMDFGSWLKQMRLERNMDLRAFADLIGINMSSVSRIENSRTQVTLSTAVRICERLEVPLPTLMQSLQGKALPDLDSLVVTEREGVLTLSDVQEFLEYIR